jgi:diacylglycerol O-acyltransferase / wax synthase
VAQQHKDRLSVLDNSFLDLERDVSHMHVGGVTLFEGPPPDAGEFRHHIECRLHLVPRYRQKVLKPPLQMGRPLWVDDPDFNVDYHVRRTALPRPGGIEELRSLAGRIFSQRLDRTKPLWEMWVVEGLSDGRFAIVSKTHHALIDGMSGVDLISLLFDATRQPREIPPPERPWNPRPVPSDAEVIAEGVMDVVRAPFALAGKALGAVRHPRRAIAEVAEAVQGIADVFVRPMLTPAPATPFNEEISSHRRVHWVTFPLADFRTIKAELGGTVNDVVLAAVAGAVRRYLELSGTRTEGLELRALVPVSIRSEDQRNTMGNRVAAMRGPLPVYVADPVERLRIVRESMQGLKESKQALGAEVISGLQEFAPPNLLAQASRLNFSTRLFNLIVTNVPGPQAPLYLLGRELEELVPFAFLPENHGLAVAIMSYNGKLSFGLLGDYDVLRDIDLLGDFLVQSVDELLEAARRTGPEPVEPDVEHVDRDAVVVAESSDDGAEDGPGPSLHMEEPWPGYAKMRSDEIRRRLADADDELVTRVHLYEGMNKRRQQVLRTTSRVVQGQG